MPRELLQELRARASAANKKDFQVGVCVALDALCVHAPLQWHARVADVSMLLCLELRDVTWQGMSRCGLVVVSAGKL